ncbi:MAG: DUF975 family protein [Kiritimatiellae bacterium]|nr:DUF975 family protein [Kiritimatiellia bacterium]
MNWYYQLDGAAQGPVSEETFRSLIARGVIRPDTLVWHEGMAEWEPLSVADPTWASGGAGAPPPAPDAFAPAGEFATFAELKTRARTGPSGNYWTYLGAMALWGLLSFAGCIPFVGFVAAVVVGFLTKYGQANLALRGADHRKLAVGDAFVGFNQFGRAFGCMFLTGLFTFLWGLLLIVPGIVKAFSYMLTPYLVLEHPEWSVTEAITESRRLMDGNKWRAFCLGLSFLGWMILGILTFGILFFWLAPYMAITSGAFYRAVLREKGPRPAPAA